MWRTPVCALLLGLSAAPAAANDNGPALLSVFERTCGQRPALPTILQQSARAAGFDDGQLDLAPEMKTPEKLNVTYFAKLDLDGVHFILNALFVDENGALYVTCDLSAPGVDEDVIAAIETAEKVSLPHIEVRNDGATSVLNWPSADGDPVIGLKLRTQRDEPRHALLTLGYKLPRP